MGYYKDLAISLMNEEIQSNDSPPHEEQQFTEFNTLMAEIQALPTDEYDLWAEEEPESPIQIKPLHTMTPAPTVQELRDAGYCVLVS